VSDLSGLPLEECAWALCDALERASHAAYEAKRAEEQAGAFRAELARRLTVGEAVLVDEATMVVLEPAKPSGRRSVNVEGVHRHVEVLGPLGLGPEEDPRPRPPKYPTLSELERRAHVLEAHGVPLDDLVVTPPLGEPQVVVVERKAEATT
jgi:hypothetical protein